MALLRKNKMCNVFQSYSAQIFHRVKSLFKYVFQMMRFKLSQHQLLLIRSLKEMSSGRRVKLIILTLGYNYNYQCLILLGEEAKKKHQPASIIWKFYNIGGIKLLCIASKTTKP